ncbi:YkgJ family cysteine cluster protein [Alloacidobacterium dinghuense]|uniref:YkgJ family cysteine cluster protein n=1 Tax=Alloacidobacterium dinghuense TaxID=2763107 RepID=A0A7G8BML2_9BACT|nr:YkgJ family cysteine cluster protein [Alloacidobacterium dinghuense]QNI33782.1 YkgJ family cysteine cluster protein [Alloacidobacterium dinghuense]
MPKLRLQGNPNQVRYNGQRALIMSDTPQPSPAVEVAFSLRIGEGTLNAKLDVPAGKTTLTELLPILQNFDSSIIDHVVSEATGAGHPVSCRAGCGACCRQMVPLSIFEAEFLSKWFSTLPVERQAELEERFRRALIRLKEAGVLDKIMDPNWGTDEKSFVQMAVDYFHAGVPCPFLEDESCSIHPIRPLICREYLVTSPAELCQDPSVHQISAIHLPIMLSQALYKMGQELTRDPRGWMPLIFLLAWGKRGVKPGDYFSGTGQEVLRMFMEHLTNEPPAAGATLMQPR